MLPIDSRKRLPRGLRLPDRQHQDQQTKCNHSRLTLNKLAGVSPLFVVEPVPAGRRDTCPDRLPAVAPTRSAAQAVFRDISARLLQALLAPSYATWPRIDGGSILPNPLADLLRCLTVVGLPARDQLVENHTQREHIGERAGFLAGSLFGRHVMIGPDNGIWCRIVGTSRWSQSPGPAAPDSVTTGT